MDERDIAMVAAAFDRLLALAVKHSDPATIWTIAAAKEDVCDILAGTWHGDEPAAPQTEDAAIGWADVFAEERGAVR